MRKSFIAAAAALAVVSSAAVAAVNFDSTTGTGFVGKGDVQLALGWNNKQAQDNAKAVTFSYNATDTYDVECEWTTTTGGPNPKQIFHDITVPKHTTVNASVAYEARLKNQYTGYILNGFGPTTVNGTVPVEGGVCPGNSNVGIITAVTLTGSTGGLFVTYNGTSVALPNTPVI